MIFAARAVAVLLAIWAGVGAARAADANTGDVAVLSQDAGSVSVIDGARASIVRSFAAGRGPAGIARAPGSGKLYVTYPDGRAIGVLEDDRLVRTVPFDGQPFGIAAVGKAIYVSDWTKGIVARIDPDTGVVTGSLTVGRSPAALVAGPDGRLYVADRESNDVSVIDAVGLRRLAQIPVGNAPFALALSPDGARLYVADVRSNDVAVIDTREGRVVGKVAVAGMPYGVAVTPDGQTVLVTSQHRGTLSMIDARTLAIVGEVDVGRYPEGVVCDDAGRAFVANWFSDDVSVIDVGGRREVRRIKVGAGPRNLVTLTAGAH